LLNDDFEWTPETLSGNCVPSISPIDIFSSHAPQRRNRSNHSSAFSARKPRIRWENLVEEG
jgi:hypothetical protein